MNQMENFRYIIVEERRRAGLTQEALATRIGITPQAVSKWENGVGYPDVTLFPIIADVLGIPISRLFGEEEKPVSRKGTLPATYGGLLFILAAGDAVCYASKGVEVADEERGIIRFADGSEANLNTATVINRGAGEIRIFKLSEILPEVTWEDETASVPLDLDSTYADIRSYRLSIGMGCDVMVTSDGEEGKCRVTATGSPRFLAAIRVEKSGECLQIEVKSENNQGGRSSENDVLHIHTGTSRGNLFHCSLNGSGNLAISPDFERMELTVNGCGDIAAANADEAVIKINGSGDIRLKNVTRVASMKVNGAGDIQLDGAASPGITVNGSGDIECGEVSGEMCATINGAGDITCGGDLTRLSLSINGSGDFHGEELAVTDAEIKALHSNAEITIGQIRGSSVEKLGKNCVLKVGKRGL